MSKFTKFFNPLLNTPMFVNASIYNESTLDYLFNNPEAKLCKLLNSITRMYSQSSSIRVIRNNTLITTKGHRLSERKVMTTAYIKKYRMSLPKIKEVVKEITSEKRM